MKKKSGYGLRECDEIDQLNNRELTAEGALSIQHFIFFYNIITT